LKKVEEKRFGNVFLDLFGFRRQTKISGWEFKAGIPAPFFGDWWNCKPRRRETEVNRYSGI